MNEDNMFFRHVYRKKCKKCLPLIKTINGILKCIMLLENHPFD